MSQQLIVHTGCRRLIGYLKLQVIFRKRATNSRALLRKMTYGDKASSVTAPPCTELTSELTFEKKVAPQHTATHCNTLQHTATHCSTLQHTATHCSTLQHTAAHCSTLQHTAAHCNTLQHTAAHCNTLQHSATNSNHAQIASRPRRRWNTLSQTSVISSFYLVNVTASCLLTKTHRTHKTIWINESSVNPKSTSNQSSKPCTVLQYPSKKT